MGGQDPRIVMRARDFYATYCASSDGKNHQGLPCPVWGDLTEAERGHWYTVALRSVELVHVTGDAGTERGVPPDSYVLGHLTDPEHALGVWRHYSGPSKVDQNRIET